jgi:hypothetical protein
MIKIILTILSTALLAFAMLIWYGDGDWAMSAYLSIFALLLSNEGFVKC